MGLFVHLLFCLFINDLNIDKEHCRAKTDIDISISSLYADYVVLILSSPEKL